jgi:hypothetical protein
METIWQADREKTDIKLKELTEAVEKTQMELQTAVRHSSRYHL